MPTHYDERWGGPIRGLRLPLTIWNSLRDEGITTIDRLQASCGSARKARWHWPEGGSDHSRGTRPCIRSQRAMIGLGNQSREFPISGYGTALVGLW